MYKNVTEIFCMLTKQINVLTEVFVHSSALWKMGVHNRICYWCAVSCMKSAQVTFPVTDEEPTTLQHQWPESEGTGLLSFSARTDFKQRGTNA